MSRSSFNSILRGLVFGAVALTATLALSTLSPVRRLESLAYDGRLELENRFRPVPRDDGIVIVGIDDQSLLNFGRWPWPREYLVDAVETLSALGARSIFMDIELPEPSRGTRAAQGDGLAHFVSQMQTFALEQLSADTGLVREKLGALGLEAGALSGVTTLLDQVVANCHTILQRSWTDPDRELAAAIRRARSRGTAVVTAYHVEPGRGGRAEWIPRLCRWILENPSAGREDLPAPLRPHGSIEERQVAALRQALAPVLGLEGPPREIALDAAFLDKDPEVRQLLRQHGVEIRERSLSHLARRALEEGVKRGTDPHPALEALRESHRTRSAAFLRAIDTEVARRRVREDGLTVEGTSTLSLPEAFELVPPIPEVALDVDHCGVINIIPDADGHTRGVPLIWAHEGRKLPSGMLALILVHLDLEASELRIEVEPGPALLLRRKAGDSLVARIPVTDDGRLMVRYSGTYENSFPVISAGLLLDYQHTSREKETYFKKQMRGSLYPQVLQLRDLASRLAATTPPPDISLADLIETMRNEHPFFLHLDAVTMITSLGDSKGSVLDAATPRPAAEWVPLLEERQGRLEENALAFQKAMAASVEKITDPAEKERKQAKVAPLVEPYRKYVQVAEKLREALAERVAGRHCMLGMTGSSSTDLGTTPLEARAPLLQVFPQGLNTVIQNRHLQRHYLVDPVRLPAYVDVDVDVGILVLVAAICIPLFTVLTSVSGGVTVLTLSALWITFASWLFMHRGIWVDMVSPIVLILVSFALIFVWRARQRESLEQLFGRYLAGEVAEALMTDDSQLELGGRQRVVTIMMTDLRGFTKLSEELGPRRMVALLNEYLSRMTDPILEFRGTINEFIGDAILVLFGAPLSRPDDVDRALACGIAMQLALVQFNKDNSERGLPSLTMGIGINTGEVVAGNIGSLKRAKYGVVGDTVNTAARVESLTIGAQVLLTAATAAACKCPVELCEPTEVRLKGKSEPMVIQELRGIQYQGTWYRMPVEAPVAWSNVELRARFSFLKGKTVSDDVEQATVISVHPGSARMTTPTRLEPSQDIVMHITWSEDSTSKPIYGRIAKRHRQQAEGKAEWTWAEVVFTAMDDSDRVLLEGMKRDVVEQASPLGEA